MLEHFKKLGNQIFVYGLGDTINKIISVLMVPLFTRYLTPSDYGVAGIMTVTAALIAIFCDLGLTNAFVRFYPEENKNDKFKLISTIQIVFLILTGTIAVLAFIFSSQLSLLFFRTADYSRAIILTFASIPLTVLMTAPLIWLRMENKSKIYATTNVARVLTGIILNIYFVVYLRQGVIGLLTSNLINTAIYSLIFMAYSIQFTKFKYSHYHFKKMFLFGSPFILGMVSFWAINWLDRFVLSRLSNLSEVGLYTLGYTMGMAIMLPVGAFNTAWPAFYMSVAKKPDAKRIYALTLTYFSLIIGFFVLIVSIFSRDYFQFFTPEKFHSAYTVVPVITLAYAFNGVFSIVTVGLFIKKKTLYEPIAEVLAMAVNLGLMFLLIPKMGKMGAAYATLAAFATISVVIYFFSRRFYLVKYEFVRLLKIILITSALYFLAHFIYQPTLANFFLRVIIVLSYPLFFFILGFFKKEEITTIKKFYLRLKRRKYAQISQK